MSMIIRTSGYVEKHFGFPKISHKEEPKTIPSEDTENIKEIKMGSKVRYKTDEDNELNLIAIHHEVSELFDSWICVNPICYSKTGTCTLYNCFTDELKLGWSKSIPERVHIEHAIAAITTGKVFPKVFETEKEAEQFKERRPDPSHWKVVSREVTYGEWK